MSPDRVSLAYSPPTRVRWYCRPLTRRMFFAAFLVALILGAMRAWRGEPGEWARVHYWYWTACRYSAAPEAIVCAYGDPDAQAAMLRNGGAWASQTSATVVFNPRAWNHLKSAVNGIADDVASTWFLHERRTPAGESCLVAVEVCVSGGGRYLSAQCYVIRRSPSDPSGFECKVACSWEAHTGLGTNARSVCMEAGQSDPNDPTHFTLPYRVNGRAGTIDGYVEGRHSAHFDERGGPASISFSCPGGKD